MEKEERIYIIGHKNPDTDSICSAIAYAYLKNKQTGTNKYKARRAGQINEETEFVLKYWGVEAPKFVANIGLQVRDMEINETEGAPPNISIRNAWELMQHSDTQTLPIMNQDHMLDGLVTVGDITNYFMNVENANLFTVGTKYDEIADTIHGEVVIGDPQDMFEEGRIIVAASGPDHMCREIEQGDLVILGDHEPGQKQAILSGAKCLVVTEAQNVSDEIRALAVEKNCVVICTEFDTYTVSRVINQSVPAESLMKKADKLVTFHMEDFVDDIRDTMGGMRYRSFPVLDRKGEYVGMIGRRNLLTATKKQVILVDHTEKSQAVDNLDQAEILEIIDHHRIGTVETMQPVFFRGDPVGCTCTILMNMYRERGMEIPKDIAGLLCSAILSDTLMFRSPTCTPRDVGAANELAAIAGINLTEYAKEMFRAGSNLKAKTPDEILHQDYKKFTIENVSFGVGQISSLDGEELREIQRRLRPQLEEECGRRNTSMVFFMLTDIMTENTILMYTGSGAEELIRDSFGVEPKNGEAFLEKVVSRKKQLIPAFMQTLQTM